LVKTTRREAIGACVVATLGLPFDAKGASEASETNSAARNKKLDEQISVKKMQPLDYGRSFICNTAEFNAVRFWLESRTLILDEVTGSSVDYYQCGSCKSENTFGEQDLFYRDNYDFLPILGDGRWLIFRRTVRLSDRYRSVAPVEDLWGTPILKLRQASQAKILASWDEIRAATAEAIPLVAQTEIFNPETRLRAILEYPVKTMNISLDKKMYQVDTGPLALPDLSQRYDPQIECLKLAYVAFNTADFADFVVEQPTAVSADGAGDCQVSHYSNPISLAATNRVIGLT